MVLSSSQSHSVPELSSLSPPAVTGAEDDGDDEELEREVMALYKQQALHAEHHHAKRSALLSLLASPSSPSSPSSSRNLSSDELVALLSSAVSSHDMSEKELTINLIEQCIASTPLTSPLFTTITPLLLSAITPAFSSCSPWWQRGVVRVLFVCSNAVEGRKALDNEQTVPALEKLRSGNRDEEVVSGVERLLECVRRK